MVFRTAKNCFMNKKALALVLFIVALLAVGYAIYRSTATTVTTVTNGQSVVYGEPQHGLTLGLCLFAGMCVIGAVLLYMDEKILLNRDGQSTNTTTTTTGNRVATNYPR
jgi:multisubunit Na+/H+ antiporter MnhB subunit